MKTVKKLKSKHSSETGNVQEVQERRYSVAELGIDIGEVSEGAMMVCRTLQEHGYDGYLVGGCVRDWLLGLHPKDFDIATNATPEQVRPLFKRARIIGRRFKLVHVHHKREMIEVATYRAAPGKEDSQHHKQSHTGRVLRDNVYGSLVEDALRRDFTINALYLDPVAGEVVDFQGGVEDIQEQLLELIGDPDLRFAEDPVRMLRALRFKAKLGFDIDAHLDELIEKHQHHFSDVSNARLFDETFKLFHHAHAVESWHTLCEHGFLPILFPLTEDMIELDEMVEDFILRALENTDRRVSQGKPVIPAFFFAVLLWHAYQQERRDNTKLPRGREGVYRAAENVFAKQYPVIAIPKRVSTVIIEIWDMQWYLEQRRPESIENLLANRRFRAAYDFLLLREKIGEIGADVPDWWTRIQDLDEAGRRELIAELPGTRKPRGARRRQPRKRNRAGS